MKKGWSLQTAASNAGITYATMESVEKGSPVNYQTINKLVKCYGISEDEKPNYLVGEDEPPHTLTPAPLPHLALHPYSGRWNFRVTCSRWEDRDLGERESVHAMGFLDLLIRDDGSNGVGTAHGTLHLQLIVTDKGSTSTEYHGRFRVVDRVEQVRCCTPDGELSFLSHTWARHPESRTRNRRTAERD